MQRQAMINICARKSHGHMEAACIMYLNVLREGKTPSCYGITWASGGRPFSLKSTQKSQGEEFIQEDNVGKSILYSGSKIYVCKCIQTDLSKLTSIDDSRHALVCYIIFHLTLLALSDYNLTFFSF